MTRLLSAIAGLALVASLAVPDAALAQPMHMGHHCPRGTHWIPGHRWHGTFIKGHCGH